MERLNNHCLYMSLTGGIEYYWRRKTDNAGVTILTLFFPSALYILYAAQRDLRKDKLQHSKNKMKKILPIPSFNVFQPFVSWTMKCNFSRDFLKFYLLVFFEVWELCVSLFLFTPCPFLQLPPQSSPEKKSVHHIQFAGQPHPIIYLLFNISFYFIL